MSITLELTELSPELEKQLAAMPESEQGKFIVALVERGYQMEKRRQEDEVRASVEESLAEDPADSMSIEDFAAERKTTRKLKS